MKTDVPARSKMTWGERKAQLRPYLESLMMPIKTIWSDPLGRLGSIVFATVLLMAIFAPWIATHDPSQVNERIEATVALFDTDGWSPMSAIGPMPLTGISFADEDFAVAVGNQGTIMIYSEGRWTTMESPTTEQLHSVALANRQFGIAVGNNGTIIQFDGQSWHGQESGVNAHLFGSAAVTANQAAVVGAEGTILLWNGQTWRQLDSAVSNNLRSISFGPSNTGIVVGDRGTILHLDGEQLTRARFRGFLDSTFRNIEAVHFFSDDLAMAVGERGTIMGYDGNVWFAMPSPESRQLRGIAIVSETEAYAVGIRGIVLSFDGTSWAVMPRTYRRDFRAIAVHGGTGAAVGTDPYINELSPPTREHLFGTTHLGRDIFSQVMYGSRTALIVGILAALVVNIIGLTVGLVSGYYRGRVDSILMRIVDIMYGLPLEPFAILLVMVFRPSIWIIIFAIGLLTWRTNARIIRSQVLTLVQRPFIKAAKVAGASNLRIMLIHITPNILPLAFLQLAVAMGYAITAEATLSFLGLGPPRVYSWGTILHAARLSGAWRTAWWWVIPPGAFICITVVSIFLVSRSLEVLTNPRLRGGNTRAPRSSKS